MKKLTLAAVALLGLSLFSCGGSSEKDIEITPSDTIVSGDLKGLYNVTNRTYKLKPVEHNDNWNISIDIERTDDNSLDISNGEIGFGIEILDNDGNVLGKENVSTYDKNGEFETIQKLKAGDKASVSFVLNDGWGENCDFTEATKFRVISKFEAEKPGVYTTSAGTDNNSSDESDSADRSSSSASSENWDAVLDSYEEYVDQYIALLKKAKEGDMTALSEYPALLEKANDFSSKLSNADSELSTSQMARYTKITAKMTKAAL